MARQFLSSSLLNRNTLTTITSSFPFRINQGFRKFSYCSWMIVIDYLNKSSIVTSDCTIPLCRFFETPYVVMNVWWSAFFVLVTCRKSVAREASLFSYSASMTNLSETYLISQILMTSSARSINKSIWPPFHEVPFLSVNGRQLHEWILLIIPPMLSACLIWLVWCRQTCSINSP